MSTFTVKDRRAFTESGDVRPEAPIAQQQDAAVEPQPPAAQPSQSPPQQQQPQLRQMRQMPPVDFHTFVISLGSSALLHLGELEPESGEPQKDLAMAKHTIDILELLQIKTKGNLTPPEDKLLGSLLYDLRLRYIGAAKQ